MINESFLKNIVNEFLEGTDRFLVELLIKPGNRILVFIDSDTSVLIDHCVALSRHIESHLSRDDEDFELNVSSAGLDQPYKLHRQYKKNIGREVAVTLQDGKKVSGILTVADASGFDVLEKKKIKKEITETLHHFTYTEIKETKEIIKF